MRMNNFLICLSGLPSSGKSFFASKLKRALENKFINLKVEVIDPDLIREIVSGLVFNYKKENKVRKKSLREVGASLKQGAIVISDDLNYYSSMRHDLKEIAGRCIVPFFIIHISTPLEQCLKWNEARGNKIPQQIIHAVNEKFDPFGEYSWDTPIKTYDLSQISNLEEEIANLLDLIILTSITSIPSEDSYQNTTKESHNRRANEKLDIVTRDIVGKLLENPKYRNLAKELAKHRKSFVKSFLNSTLSEKELEKQFISFIELKLNLKIDL